MTPAQRARIRALNDELRQHRAGGRITFSPAVDALGLSYLREILEVIGRSQSFDDDAGQPALHERGSVLWRPRRLIWEISYHQHPGIDDPIDPSEELRCLRVLTVSFEDGD